jgi:hypothetical protein
VSCDLAQPTEIRTSAGNAYESGCTDEPERLVEHVLSRMPKPSRAGMPTPLALVELGDQEPSGGFEHPIHFLDCGPLIILSDVVQSERARDGVEARIRKREVLRESDLEPRRYSTLARLAAGTVDHLDCCINAVHGAGGSYPLREDEGEAARAAADIENPVTRPKLQIVGQHRAQTGSALAEQDVAQIVNTRPVDEPVAAVVMGVARGVDHRHASVRRSPR